MPEDIRETENLIDVGETVGAEINLDDKGEPEKVEAPVEEKLEGDEEIHHKERKTLFGLAKVFSRFKKKRKHS